MRLLVESVDPGSLEPIRDITPIVDASADASVSLDLESDVCMSGSLGFIGNEAAVSPVIRVSLTDDDGLTTPVATGFARVSERMHFGTLGTGRIELEGLLAALRDTCAPYAYVVPGGTSAASVIRDVCAQVGRPTAIPDDFGAGSFTQCIIYEAGTPWLTVAQEAAARCDMRLVQDALGFITLAATGDAAGETSWMMAAGATDITSRIEKSQPEDSSPTRVVATWSSADKALTASADAAQRGVHPRDVHLDVSDMETPSVSVLQGLAQQELSRLSSQEVEWKFEALYRPEQLGTRARITDLLDPGTLDGVITSIELSLLPVLTMSVVVRGEVS